MYIDFDEIDSGPNGSFPQRQRRGWRSRRLTRIDWRRLRLPVCLRRLRILRAERSREQAESGKNRQLLLKSISRAHQKFTRVVNVMLRIAPAPVTLPNVAEFTTVEIPEKFT